MAEGERSKRNRTKQSETLKARLQKFAAEWRAAALKLPVGKERDALFANAEQAESTAALRAWITRTAASKITMKMISEYLEHAITFERMASDEDDPKLKAHFEKQAAAYRKPAKERAAQYGMPAPSPSDPTS